MKIDSSKYLHSGFVFGIDNIDWNYMANIIGSLQTIDCIFYDEQNYPLRRDPYIRDKFIDSLTQIIRKDLL